MVCPALFALRLNLKTLWNEPMPNGESTSYNSAWCQEKHEKIDEQIRALWSKIDKQAMLLWGILLTHVATLGGIIAILFRGGGG
jgi:hypothetical protein